jgi:hypothetical protein
MTLSSNPTSSRVASRPTGPLASGDASGESSQDHAAPAPGARPVDEAGAAAEPAGPQPDGSLPDVPKAVFIDWGPDLPGRFPTGRARLLVVNPTTLHLSWEVPATSAHASADAWIAEVRVDDGIVRESRRVESVPGYFANSCWLTVSPRTSGVVRLLSTEGGLARRVADLPFETPPAAPSTDFTERWGTLDRLGSLIRDAEAVEGARVVEVSPEPPRPTLVPTSSTSAGLRPRG